MTVITGRIRKNNTDRHQTILNISRYKETDRRLVLPPFFGHRTHIREIYRCDTVNIMTGQINRRCDTRPEINCRAVSIDSNRYTVRSNGIKNDSCLGNG